MINWELANLQAASQSDVTGRILEIDGRGCKYEQMALVRTCRRISRILSWNDSDVGNKSAVRTDSKEEETSDVVTSMHSSRGDSAQIERSPKEGVKEKTAVSEASRRKQESNERLAVPQVESEEARRVKSVWKAGTESGKQDDEAIERGESVGTKGSGGHSQSQDWKDIWNIVGGYEDAEDVDDGRIHDGKAWFKII